MIKLIKYHEKYRDALMAFHLSNEDSKYTALPNAVLDETLSNEHKTAVVILKDDSVAGFFVLHAGSEIQEYIDPANTLLVRALSIDSKYHRQGIGFTAMHMLSQFVLEHFKGKKTLALAVNLKNEKAQRLYFKAGYTEDHRRMGLKGEQMVLVKSVSHK